LQHVPFEGLGSIENWLEETGYEVTCTHLYANGKLPAIGDIDLLVIMGGPMSVNDEAEFPWLVQEKAFIQGAIGAGIPTLGICLGAQLIASSMGGEVFPNPLKEIGWFPVTGVNPQSESAFRFPEATEVFHWHGETFSLPMSAVRLAESQACKNQAFQIGTHVIGMQFHLETTAMSAKALVENCRDELIQERYIQSEAEILSAPEARYRSINGLMKDILEYLHSGNG
jgi:GMP synthase-like glutamine amidotransferase